MEAEMTDPMELGHLVNVDIRGLFGFRDIGFDMALREPTILTGSNGSGKSTILRIINSVATGDWAGIARLPFTRIELEFERGTVARVENEPGHVLVNVDGDVWSFDPDEAEKLDYDINEFIAEHTRQVGPDRFEYRGDIVNRWEVADLIRSQLLLDSSDEDVQWVSDFTDSLSILFVTDQRLVVTEAMRQPTSRRFTHPPRVRSAVLDARRDLRGLIREALSDYASHSQVLDRNFPYRVVEALQPNAGTDTGSLSLLVSHVSDQRTRLQTVGLLPPDLPSEPFQELPLDDPNVAPVIQTFLEDTLAKFEVLQDLQERLALFVRFLNQHYKGKILQTNPDIGFEILVPTEGADDDSPLSPTYLSSGEQQILVLAYEILFRSVPGTLVLIDEPELSLHVVWQDTFVDDVEEMGAVRDLQFLLATHSPALIAGRSELRRSLDMPVGS